MVRVRGLVVGLVVAVGVGLVSPWVGPAVAEPSSAGEPAGGEPSGLAESESVRAAETGEPVEVERLTTQTQRVMANPDGTFTLESSPRPVRVATASGWVDVDTTLSVNGQGVVVPAHVAVEVELSNGGAAAPLARIGWAGRVLSVSWPDPLPTPVLDGDTATYSNVFPDVDLVVTADVEGYSDELVIKTPEAADNPDLDEITMGVDTEGLTVESDGGGGYRAIDTAGRQWFQAPAPLMTDSFEPDPEAPAATPDAAGDSPHTSQAGLEVGDGHLVLTPDQELLDAPGTVYPVVVDPPTTGNFGGWATVWREFPNSPHWNSTDPAKVGHSNEDSVTVRSLFEYNVGVVRGKHVLSATLRTFETHSWSCSPRDVELWKTGNIGTGTTWNNQPAWQTMLERKNIAHGYSGGCPDSGVDFNATAAVASVANAGQSTLTLGLRASNESDTFAWKKFRNHPTLEVKYNSVPNVPTGLTTDPVSLPRSCTSDEARRPLLSTGTPRLKARVTDPDRGMIRAQFEWSFGGAPLGSATTAPAPSGSVFSVPIPAGVFGNGSTLAWHVRAIDQYDPAHPEKKDVSAYSTPTCKYTIDSEAPDKAPGVASTDYPPDGFAGGVGEVGEFAFTPNGVGDVASYKYGLNQDPPSTNVTADGSGSATVKLVPHTDGPNFLLVRSVDHVGNLSPITTYEFFVNRPRPPSAYWKLDELFGVGVADSSGNGHPGTATSGVTWVDGQVDGAARFNGTTGQISTTDPVIRTDQSFTVSAWARLGATNTLGSYMVASKDGTQHSGFTLKFQGGSWTFAMPRTDSASPLYDQVSASGGLPHEWTHLVAVFDATVGHMRLYVNGVLKGTTARSARWNAAGPLVLGRAYDGAPTSFWDGAIDDVRFFDRVVFDDEVRNLVNGQPLLVGHWPTDEGAGTVAHDTSGNHRDGALLGGTRWDQASIGSVVQFDGVSGRIGIGEAPLPPAPCGCRPIPIPEDPIDPQLASNAEGDPVPVVRTDLSFTVTAWVRLDASAHAYTAVSQDGNRQSGFYLGYSPEGQWAFTMMTADADNPAHDRVAGLEPPQLGAWTHLTGVYDAPLGQMRLYVNGVLAGRTTHTSGWNATGGTQIGRGKWNGNPVDWWAGGIDDVRAYTGVLSARDIAILAAQ